MAVKGVNFRITGTNAAGPAMKQFQSQLAGVQAQTKSLQPLQASWNRGLNENRRMVQQLGFQLGDFATQIAGGQSAMLAFVQQGGQMLQFFGVFGAVAAAALAVFGSLFIAITRSGVALGEITPLLGILQDELWIFAEAFRAAFDVIIWVVNLVLNNLDVLATMGLIYLSNLAVGAVLASNSFRALLFTMTVLGPVQGALAAGAWALTAAMTALRSIILTVLPLAFLAAVAWLIVKFIELIQLAGSFGEVMRLLGGLVVSVFEFMVGAAKAFYHTVEGGVYGLTSAFMEVFSWIMSKWEGVINAMIDGWNAVMDAVGMEGSRADPYKSTWLDSAAGAAGDFAKRSSDAFSAAGAAWFEGAEAVDIAWGKITDLFKNKKRVDVRDWFGGGDVDTPGGGSGGKGGKSGAIEKLKEEADEIKKIFEDVSSSIESALMSGFKAVIRGTKSLKDYAIDMLNTILDKTIELLMQPIFAGIANSITRGIFGFVGMPSFAGGGFTGPGSRSGGMDGKGGFMAMLHPNETVIDHTVGSKFSGGTGEVHVYVHENEMFAAKVEAVSRDVAVSTVRTGLKEYDRRVLPRSSERISSDPMVR